MFSMQKIKNNQPISWTGIVRHTCLWMLAGLSDQKLSNPNFQASKAFPHGVAIYCVHGTADRVSAFSLIGQRLLTDLPASVSHVHLLSFSGPMTGHGIDEYANQVLEKIANNQDKHVLLMGHSRGGLIAAQCALMLKRQGIADVLGVFAIGSPFYGTHLALPPLSWISTSVAQMQLESEYLKNLRTQIISSDIKFCYISAANDAIVPLSSSFIIEKCYDKIVLERHGHLSVMSSLKLVLYLLQKIAELTAFSVPQLTLEDEPEEVVEGEGLSHALIEFYYEMDVLIAEYKNQFKLLQSPQQLQTLVKLRSQIYALIETPNALQGLSLKSYVEKILADDNFFAASFAQRWLGAPFQYAASFFNGISPTPETMLQILIAKYDAKTMATEAPQLVK